MRMFNIYFCYICCLIYIPVYISIIVFMTRVMNKAMLIATNWMKTHSIISLCPSFDSVYTCIVCCHFLLLHFSPWPWPWPWPHLADECFVPLFIVVYFSPLSQIFFPQTVTTSLLPHPSSSLIHRISSIFFPKFLLLLLHLPDQHHLTGITICPPFFLSLLPFTSFSSTPPSHQLPQGLQTLQVCSRRKPRIFRKASILVHTNTQQAAKPGDRRWR